MQAARASRIVYGLLALGLIAYGVFGMARSAHACTPVSPRSLGGTFLLGALSSIVVSPCCAPVLFALGTIAGPRSLLSIGTLAAAFFAGHLAPLVFLLPAWRIPFAPPAQVRDVTQTVSAGLLVALGGYYAVLA